MSTDDGSFPLRPLVLVADHLATPLHLRAALSLLLRDACTLCESGIQRIPHFHLIVEESAADRSTSGSSLALMAVSGYVSRSGKIGWECRNTDVKLPHEVSSIYESTPNEKNAQHCFWY